MTITLWRGAQFLGDLLQRPPSPHDQSRRPGRPSTLSAVLLPRDPSSLESVWQLRVPFGPSARVLQQPLEADIVSERYSGHKLGQASSGPVALEPVTPDQDKGIAFEQQLRIVGDSGEERPTISVQVLESRYEEKDYAVPLREIPAAALVNGSVWTVFVAFDDALDSTIRRG